MIYIIVPTFARVEDTKNFLSSIQESIKKDYLVLLIDDHPEKPTFKEINQNINVKVFPQQNELWWVGCINYGIQVLYEHYELGEDDIVIFANNDIQIKKDSFDILYNEIQREKEQIIHPRTFNQNGEEVSSGAKIFTFFPYVTSHPKKFTKEKEIIHMGTGRFLMMGASVLNKVGSINHDLIQYGGDNDFTLSASQFHKIRTYIMRDALCTLDDVHTGLKNHNIRNLNELLTSFFAIKSPNNIKYRYILFKKYFGRIGASFITLNISFNTLIKFIIKKFIN